MEEVYLAEDTWVRVRKGDKKPWARKKWGVAWRIEYAESVHKSVRRPDRQAQRRLLDFPELRLAHMDNPRQPGAAAFVTIDSLPR